MAYTYEELKGMTVAQLREIAKPIEHEAVHGYSTMHKEKLVPALCAALGIDARVHHVAHGEAKTKAKEIIREMKKKRDEAIAAKDKKAAQEARKVIRAHKRKLRKLAS